MRTSDVLLAFSFCFCASAQEQASIQGVVVNSLTGEALTRVHVRLMMVSLEEGATGAYGALSDDAGRFSIAPIQPGTYFIRSQRVGFLPVPSQDKQWPQTPVVVLRNGQRLENFRIEMAPRAVVSGRVLDQNGDPVRKVAVSAEPVSGDHLWLTLNLIGSSDTDDRGEYRLSLPPGKYRIKAEVDAFPSGEPEEIRTDGTTPPLRPATWFPSAASTETATAVEVKPGRETAGMDIRMGRSVTLVVSGTVTGIPGGASAYVNVCASLQHGESFNEIRADSDGSFSLGGLGPGTYYLYARSTSEEQKLRSAVVELHLTASAVTSLELALRAGSDLTGTLEMPAGGGVSANRAVRLEPMTGPMGETRTGVVTREGTFQIKEVEPERYRVEVRPLPEDSYVKTVLLGGAVVAGGILDLRNGANSLELKITVSDSAARISGVVEGKSGRLTHGFAAVWLVREGAESLEDVHETKTSSDGTYSLMGIPPGKYRLLALDLLGDLFGRPLKEYLAVAQVIEVKEGDRITKDLKAMVKEDIDGKRQ